MLGVDTGRFKVPIYDSTQKIGGAAYFLGFDGLIVPSARWSCHNVVLFTGRIELEDLEEIKSESVGWELWRVQRAQSTI